MTRIVVEIKPETQQYINAMLSAHTGTTEAQLAGHMLDCQVAYRLEVERMKPATIDMDHPFGGGY